MEWLALALTDNAIRATAAPIILDEERGRGRTSALSAQVQAYGLAITISLKLSGTIWGRGRGWPSVAAGAGVKSAVTV